MMTITTTAPSLPPPLGLDFTGAQIANHRPGARVRTWTGELGEVLNLGGERRGMCPLEHRVYRARLDGETVVHEWRAWMLTAVTSYDRFCAAWLSIGSSATVDHNRRVSAEGHEATMRALAVQP